MQLRLKATAPNSEASHLAYIEATCKLSQFQRDLLRNQWPAASPFFGQWVNRTASPPLTTHIHILLEHSSSSTLKHGSLTVQAFSVIATGNASPPHLQQGAGGSRRYPLRVERRPYALSGTKACTEVTVVKGIIIQSHNAPSSHAALCVGDTTLRITGFAGVPMRL